MATPPSQLSFFPDDWPDGLTCLENYISEDEADMLVQEIDAAHWCTDLKRQVQHYGDRYDDKARQARREDYLGPLPELFQELAERSTSEGHFQTVPDQVIVNEYQPGQGISAHIDCQCVAKMDDIRRQLDDAFPGMDPRQPLRTTWSLPSAEDAARLPGSRPIGR